MTADGLMPTANGMVQFGILTCHGAEYSGISPEHSGSIDF